MINPSPDTGSEIRAIDGTAPVAGHRNAAGTALVVLAVLAVIFMLHWAKAVFIPLMVGVLVSYALSPLVNRLQRLRVPRAVGAALLLLGSVGLLGSLVYSLSDEAATLVETLPEAAQNLRKKVLKQTAAPVAAMESVQEAAAELEKVAQSGAPPSPVPRGVTRVQIEKPNLDIQDYVWLGTVGAATAVGQFAVVLFLAYFLLISGDSFRRKLVKISGPTLSRKKITIQVLDDITQFIQRYLLVQIFTSVLVGTATWLAFWWIGVDNAAIWGVAAGVFNSVPYLGPVIVSAGSFLVAFLQFGTFSMAFLVGGVALLITTTEGYLLTPWLAGRASRMSPVVVFIGVLFWGWLWGVWGLLLGVPILMAIKAVCDRVEDLRPIGELLGD